MQPLLILSKRKLKESDQNLPRGNWLHSIMILAGEDSDPGIVYSVFPCESSKIKRISYIEADAWSFSGSTIIRFMKNRKINISCVFF